MNRRVVVTGLGVVSSIGTRKEVFWNNLIAGKCGIDEVSTFSTDNYEIHRGGEVKNFSPEDFVPKEEVRNIARASQFGIAAAKMAIEDAGLDRNRDGGNIAILVGTTMGEGGMIEEIDKHWTGMGEEDVWGITISKYPSNAISDNLSRILGLEGVSWVIPTACSAGNYSIGFGYDLIRSGRTNCAIVGGTDPFSRIGFTGFGRLFSMSPDFCRPFDKNRKGMMVGEGSGMLILEEYDSAKKRGANIYAEVKGYGLSCDAHHMTAPQVEGIAKAMKKAIKNSLVEIENIGYICAHGTGTPANDRAETEAIKKVFGKQAKEMYVSSIKSMLGHTMGAASAIEAVSCCLALTENKIPPTMNYEIPDPGCDLNYVTDGAINIDLKIVMNNSSAFGGNNASLILEKYAE